MSVAEIAKQAGVSPATVSRVLNNSPRVNARTAEEVRRVARLLDYDMQDVRRGPKRVNVVPRRVGRLCVMSVGEQQQGWFQIPVFASVVASITKAAQERGWQVQLGECRAGDARSLSMFDAGLDGVIAFVSSGAPAGLMEGIRRRVPVVRVMGEELSHPEVDQVRPDHFAIGAMAYSYLRSKGCERLVYVTTRMEHEAFVLRAMGFSVAASRAGAGAPELLAAGGAEDGAPSVVALPVEGVRRFESLDAVAEAIAVSPARAAGRSTGLFVSRDAETIGLYPLLARRGIIPGRDVTIVSCDNQASSLSMFTPAPATIDVGTEQIGRLAVTRLINRVARPDEPPIRMLVSPRLVEVPG